MSHLVWRNTHFEQALGHCDLFVAIGTSGNVYPAADCVEMARYHHAHTVAINREPSTARHQGVNSFDEHIVGPETVPEFFH
ncbi:hypothetical protein AB835_09055 [Candidatus Endobugula sertula]|uniref:Deacetylase sirtuin-type domain-containing protein n=1 Tax=Candidatus Endobugula sertula TaxID=62101 RepID=A0A1D2QPB4_9GAMM|nr:hypothetical protein AB835_09055 [Candidatus Endobugula sertula]